nr:chemotaxis-specific protein-glutamate methyltransferase CheB [Sphingomonas nostoxanthinifaciens]
MRRLLTDIFTDAGFEVAVARNADEAIVRLHADRPDVITLDIHMPGGDGLACLDRIMLERPTPVVMISALTSTGADETLEAMELGAVDFVSKPAGAISLEIEKIAAPMVEKVRAAATARISRTARLAERVRLKRGTPVRPPTPPEQPREQHTWVAPDGEGLVLVGSSTGGPPALEALLAPLPADFRWPIVIAQHMPASFTGQLAARLDRLCDIAVEEVSKTVLLQPGRAYIGRGGADLIIARRRGGLVALAAPEASEFAWHPSVDRLVESAMSQVAPERIIGVLMTGMGSDGAKAMTKLHEDGGFTIAEARETAVIWGMPGSLVELGGAARVAPLPEIAADLLAAAK